MRLEEKLKKLDRYPFHMPGHKRNGDFSIPCSDIDITEIDGFDNLHNAEGILKDIETELSTLYGSKRSCMLVNGSTCGILASIFALCDCGDKIIIARNCHKSVYNACYLRRLRVEYIYPTQTPFGCGAVTQEDIDTAIAENPDAKAIVITSPTYEGIISRVKCKIPLLVDSAHGAHLGFSPLFPQRMSGDITVQSLHKTLPALTQTAVLNVYNPKLEPKIKKYIDMFETSSPSYVLMNSVSRCVFFLESSVENYNEFSARLDRVYDTLENCRNLIFCNEKTNGGFEQDRSRIVIGSSKEISGVELAEMLRKDYSIEPEAVTSDYVILISTVCDTDEGINLLCKAIKEINSRIDSIGNKSEKNDCRSIICEKSFETWETESVIPTPFNECIGKVCGEFIYAYPPGIPIIAPGEIISGEILARILDLGKKNVNLISDGNLLPHQILTKA